MDGLLQLLLIVAVGHYIWSKVLSEKQRDVTREEADKVKKGVKSRLDP